MKLCEVKSAYSIELRSIATPLVCSLMIHDRGSPRSLLQNTFINYVLQMYCLFSRFSATLYSLDRRALVEISPLYLRKFLSFFFTVFNIELKISSFVVMDLLCRWAAIDLANRKIASSHQILSAIGEIVLILFKQNCCEP